MPLDHCSFQAIPGFETVLSESLLSSKRFFARIFTTRERVNVISSFEIEIRQLATDDVSREFEMYNKKSHIYI